MGKAFRVGVVAWLWIMAAHACFAGMVRVKLDVDHQITLGFDSDARILCFPQVHYADGVAGNDRTEVLFSQYCLATFLQENPNYVVFQEGGTDNGMPATSEAVTEILEQGFPGKELPSSLAAMTWGQQSFLIRYGGSSLLYHLGKLPRFYGATPVAVDQAVQLEKARRLPIIKEIRKSLGEAADDNEEYNNQITALNEQIMTVREKAAVENINRFLAAHPTQKVLLVYGMGHRFRDYFPDGDFAEFTGMEVFPTWAWARPAKEVESKGESKEERKDPKAGGIPILARKFKLSQIEKLEGKQTLLMKAVIQSNLDLVKILLQGKVDARVKDPAGYTALLRAALAGNEPIVKELLKHLRPSDVLAPVLLFEGDILRSYEDSLLVIEEANMDPKRDHKRHDLFNVIQLLRQFTAGSPPVKSYPGLSPGLLGNDEDWLDPAL